MKGGEIPPDVANAMNEARRRTTAEEYGKFLLNALQSSGMFGRPFNETPIGQAAALRGLPLAQQLQISPDDPAFGFAGTTVGKAPRIARLPDSSSLAAPGPPTAEIMKQFSRVESVPLDMARGTQPKMAWEKFYGGDHPAPLVEGYADKPVAVRREDGEYLIFDGHHRTAAALSDGQKSMDMYVIDAKSYAPEVAGRKPSPRSISDEDLLRALLGNQ